MPLGYDKAIVFLHKPIKISNVDALVIYCRPKLDSNSPLSGLGSSMTLIDLGYDSDNIGYSTRADNIFSIVYEYSDGAIALKLADFQSVQGYVSLI